MDWTNFLSDVMQVCVVPLLGVLTTYLVLLIKNKTKQITDSTNNDLADKYITMLSDTITTCVIATKQTYVDALKEKDLFDADAQKAALQMTADAVQALLTDEAKKYLNQAYGDLNAFILLKIEAEVNQTK